MEQGHPGPLGLMHHLVMVWAINHWPSTRLTGLALSWACLPAQLLAFDSMNAASHASPKLSSSPKIATCRTGWLSLGQSLLLLLGQIFHLGPCLPQLAPARHVGGWCSSPIFGRDYLYFQTIPSPRALSVSFLARDWDGEREGMLPNTSVSSGPFQPLGGVRVWPSVWMLNLDF